MRLGNFDPCPATSRAGEDLLDRIVQVELTMDRKPLNDLIPVVLEKIAQSSHRIGAHQRHESLLAVLMLGSIKALHRTFVLQQMLDRGRHRPLTREPIALVEHVGGLGTSNKRDRSQGYAT